MPLDAALVPHIDQYVGAWAMREQTFQSALEQVRSMDLLSHVLRQRRASAPQPPQRRTKAARREDDAASQGYKLTDDGVAVIEIVGTLTKYGSSLVSGPAMVRVRHRLRRAIDDAQVKSIVLLIDSPGGTVSGTGDLADDIAAANARKPVVAYIEDTGCSAAYWLASQAGRVIASPHAITGSIGVYCVVYDTSAMYAEEGIKAHVVRAGQFKGVGEYGAEITDEHLAELQREIDAINDLFVGAVARGRGMTDADARALADGRVHVGAAARDLGLVDEIGTFDAALETAAEEGRRPAAERAAAAQPRSTTVDAADGAPTGAVIHADKAGDESMPDEEKKKDDEQNVAEEDEKKDEQAAEDEEEKKDEAPPPTEEDDEKKKDEQAAAGASVKALRAAVPQADSDFILMAYENGMTTSQAKAAFAHQQNRSGKTAQKAVGGRGLPDRKAPPRIRAAADRSELEASAGDHPFIARAKEIAAADGVSLHDAKHKACEEDPEQYRAYREMFRTEKPRNP